MTRETTPRSEKHPYSRTNDAENNTPFGKTTPFPNGQRKKQLPVRKNTPIPVRMTPGTIPRSEKHPNSRTEDTENNTPFGKIPQFPNGRRKKQYPVREKTQIPERTTQKTTLRPGKNPNSRTEDAENNTPFGKTHQFPNGQRK